MDDFVKPQNTTPQKSMRGVLAQYADKSLAEREKGAWARAMVKK